MSSVIFFGSFQHYSTKVLEALTRPGRVKVLAVVTTPPRPAGRKKTLTPTHTHAWAEKHGLPVFTPEK
ncbi:MAG: methionyl-tRNA formyltransferase, partial [Candidatus Chisholmbacteria bacterium]|nr:methionyl-tRNA formyltransferase [Candidatus Chisholmbacteria bacterium]